LPRAALKTARGIGPQREGVEIMPDEPKPALPERVRLLRPYGFIDDEGRNRTWKAGEVIASAEEVALLTERAAPIEAA
jgi:hypothetical protein